MSWLLDLGSETRQRYCPIKVTDHDAAFSNYNVAAASAKSEGATAVESSPLAEITYPIVAATETPEQIDTLCTGPSATLAL